MINNDTGMKRLGHMPFNTLLTQTLLTPRWRARPARLAKPSSASIRRYVCYRAA